MNGKRFGLGTTNDGKVSRGQAGAAGRTRWATAVQLGGITLLIALFVALGIVVRSGRTLAFDERAHRAIRGHVPTEFEEDDTSLRTRFMQLGVDIGSATVILAPLTALALWHQRRRHAAAVVLASVAGALLLNLCLKGVFQRMRPDHVCTHGPLCVIGYLYPSTHTILTVVTYGLIGALLGASLPGWRRAVISAFVILLVGFVGTSLVYLDTHYLTDVLGGLLIGGAWLILSLQIVHALERPERPRTPHRHESTP